MKKYVVFCLLVFLSLTSIYSAQHFQQAFPSTFIAPALVEFESTCTLLQKDTILSQFPSLAHNHEKQQLLASLARLLHMQTTMYHNLQAQKWIRAHKRLNAASTSEEATIHHERLCFLKEHCDSFSKQTGAQLESLYRVFGIPYTLDPNRSAAPQTLPITEVYYYAGH